MKSTFSSTQRGSAFITVMMFCTILLLLIASVLKYSTQERRLNNRGKLLMEAAPPARPSPNTASRR